MKYKINHKLVKSFYSAEENIFIDDVYLINALDRFSVMSRRDSRGRLRTGDRFCELLSLSDRNELKNYIYDERQYTLVLKTDVGTALINKYLLASSLVLVVSFLCGEKDDEVAMIACGLEDCKLSLPSAYCRSAKRIANVKKLKNDISAVVEGYIKHLEVPAVWVNNTPRTTVRSFQHIVKELSVISGCSVELICHAEIVCDEGFDLCLFKAYILSLFMLARRVSPERMARLEITKCSEGISARVLFFDKEARHALLYPEISFFWELADRNNMLFEASAKDGIVNVRFCPTRKDWSIVELKAPVDFDWNS